MPLRHINLIQHLSAQIMATPEERRNVNHVVHDVSIDQLQQFTDLHMQQVRQCLAIVIRSLTQRSRTFSVELDEVRGDHVRRHQRDDRHRCGSRDRNGSTVSAAIARAPRDHVTCYRRRVLYYFLFHYATMKREIYCRSLEITWSNFLMNWYNLGDWKQLWYRVDLNLLKETMPKNYICHEMSLFLKLLMSFSIKIPMNFIDLWKLKSIVKKKFLENNPTSYTRTAYSNRTSAFFSHF